MTIARYCEFFYRPKLWEKNIARLHTGIVLHGFCDMPCVQAAYEGQPGFLLERVQLFRGVRYNFTGRQPHEELWRFSCRAKSVHA